VTAVCWAAAVAPGWGAASAQPPAGGAQEPSVAPLPGAAAAGSERRQGFDLSTRFRFIERYGAGAGPGRPQDREIGQYRVATRDVLKVVTEKPQGAPDRSERTVQVIYTERPAAVSTSGAVTDTVRRYDALRVSPNPGGQPPASKVLEGLTLWYRPQAGARPQLIVLGDRRMSETEYKIVAVRQLFLPDLGALLPPMPKRVGDRWIIPRPAAQALLGERPEPGGESLVARLDDVHKAATGTDHVAVISVQGRARLPLANDTLLNAQLLFTFTPTQPERDPERERDGGPAFEDMVDARGAITEVRLARSSVSGVPGSNGRLKLTRTWELTLQRQLGGGAPLALPVSAPKPTEANSWLTYDDPDGRFHFRHPQELQPDPNIPEGGDSISLVDIGSFLTSGIPDRALTVLFQPKTGDAQADRDARDPEALRKSLKEEWDKSQWEVIPGKSGWLPDADWAPQKMRVYRVEAALKTGGPGSRSVDRIFADYYLVLFARNESFNLTAMTTKDDPLAFRQQVEAVLKTLQLGPSKPPGTAGTGGG
jgi:hypothetical protein